MAQPAKNGGVQSVGRVLDLLEIVGDAGGEIGLSELAARSGLPLPSIHRLVRTLVPARLHAPAAEPPLRARRSPRPARPGRGHDARRMGAAGADRARRRTGRVREPRRPRPRRRDVHRPGALPAHDADVHRARAAASPRTAPEWARRCCHSSRTRRCASCSPARACPPRPRTRSPTPRCCWPSWRDIRRDGHAMDEGEQEIGVRCVAVPVQGALGTLGISVSGPAPRMTAGADRPRHPPAPRGRRAAVVGDRRALDGLTGLDQPKRAPPGGSCTTRRHHGCRTDGDHAAAECAPETPRLSTS